MTDLLTALALVFVIEGAIYALFPATMRRILARLPETSDSLLRTTGLIAVAVGVFAVWVIRT